MHDHAKIRPRGFDTIRERAEIHAEIDDMLDEMTNVRTGKLAVVFHAPADESRVRAEFCSMCDRARYINDTQAIICLHCDDTPPGGSWYSLDGEDAEQ